MDFQMVISFMAPLIVIFVTKYLKKLVSSKFAPLIVLGLGGISALIGVGPTPGDGFVDNTVNIAWVSGGATLIYDLFKKLFEKKI